MGEGACHGRDACHANSGDVQKASDWEFGVPREHGSVGEAACIGIGACPSNTGRSPSGVSRPRACNYREGLVGDNSCVGDFACALSGPGAIGKGACKGDRAGAAPAHRGGDLQRPAGERLGGLRDRAVSSSHDPQRCEAE